MGKRQHQKDKMYLTYSEWSTLYGGKISGKPNFRRLPFDYCSITFQPLENPFCDRKGNMFELTAIIRYIKQFKCNPITGEPIDAKSLVKLKFSKNAEGKFQCPVLFKEISPNSHIAAIAVTGNVYLYEAIKQLNIQAKNYTDLITGEEFKKSDIIILQDPGDLSKFNMENFHHLRNNHKLVDENAVEEKGGESNLKTVNKEARSVLDELKTYKAPEKVKESDKPVPDRFNTAHYSTGTVAAGFTSTTMAPETTHQAAVIEEDEVRYELVKKKGYVRLVTNFGALNFELHCDLAPRASENFIRHCHDGYYNGTIFHRSIKHFVLQGGDPSGTGRGGDSIWKKPFKDEFRFNLSHTGRGVLSMANSGPDTNKSQFFVTYRSCKYLDQKHTVFGQLVGGMDTLTAIEAVEVDKDDRPIEDIMIEKAVVFVNPFQEVDEHLAEERARDIEKAKEDQETVLRKANADKPLRLFKEGVGKYIDPKVISALKGEMTPTTEKLAAPPPVKKSKVKGCEFKNFDNW